MGLSNEHGRSNWNERWKDLRFDEDWSENEFLSVISPKWRQKNVFAQTRDRCSNDDDTDDHGDGGGVRRQRKSKENVTMRRFVECLGKHHAESDGWAEEKRPEDAGSVNQDEKAKASVSTSTKDGILNERTKQVCQNALNLPRNNQQHWNWRHQLTKVRPDRFGRVILEMSLNLGTFSRPAVRGRTSAGSCLPASSFAQPRWPVSGWRLRKSANRTVVC